MHRAGHVIAECIGQGANSRVHRAGRVIAALHRAGRAISRVHRAGHIIAGCIGQGT